MMADFMPVFLAVIAIAGRICVGLIFCLAALGKLAHWRILPGVIANYRLLPRAAVAPAALLLPPLELVLGTALITGVMLGWAVPAAAALLLLFAGAMAINLRRGRDAIDCGCGQSHLRQTISATLVARNAALAALLLPSLGAPASATQPILLAGIGAGLAFALLGSLLNTISALARPA